MTDPVTVSLLGQPIGKGRPRFNRKSGRAYTPERTASNAAMLRLAATEAMRGRELLDGPLRLHVYAELAIPASWSRRKRDGAILGIIRPIGRPDLDNIVKQVKDAFNGVVYVDDSRVCVMVSRKLYGVQPKVVATVSPLPPGRLALDHPRIAGRSLAAEPGSDDPEL